MTPVLRACSLLALLGATPQLHALGLGEAEVRSNLSSPLRVDIPLVELAGSGVAVDDIRITIPGEDEQLALGEAERILPRGARASLVALDGGGALVRITTERASREPVLRFLLRAEWPGGTTLRRYELIVDPPAVALPTPRLREPRVVRVTPAAPPARAQLLAPPTGARAPARAGSSYGPVRAGDTLYAIIGEAYPALVDDAARVADAIVARNPQAFVGGDPGRVLLGATLELPSSAVAASAARAPATTVASTPTAAAPPAGGEGYTVRAGDTLYGIVRAATGAEGAALAAAVDRVHAANPQAFIDGDRDRLRVGAALTLDGAADVAAGAATIPLVPAPSPVSSPASSTGTAQAPASATAEPPAVSAEAVAAVQAELSTLEQVIGEEKAREAELTTRLDRVLAEAAELRAREAQLTEQTAELRSRLADVAPVTAAALDAADAATESTAPPQAGETGEPATSVSSASGESSETVSPASVEPTTTVSSVTGESSTTGSPATADSAAPGAPSTASEPTPATAPDAVPAPVAAPAASAPPVTRALPPTHPRGMLDRLLSTVAGLVSGIGLYVIGGALLLVVLVLGALALRRRSARQSPVMNAAARAGEEAAKRRLAEVREAHAGASTGDFTDDGEIVRAGSQRTVVMTDAAKANRLAKEAAVHMAYGNMEESKACILEAIRLDPARDEHRMMLVTVYESTNEHAKARAIVDDLLKRREELPQELRAEVERKLQAVKAG